ncbi:polysaccharide deacetylase family protein [Gracilibacillus xinjiangensis]|uniref:Polysaccharide deacetylase family protein n=1 Tax=Gracilibacillus xinjiangensis TaxID=1193282 RepID=A0ABV8WWP6_9BACI
MLKTHGFNILFTIIFISLFTSILLFYRAEVGNALLRDHLFPRHDTFNLASCQAWAKEVRDFNVRADTMANKVTVLVYHRVIQEKDIKSNLLHNDGSIVDTVIKKSNFEQQMDWLYTEGYTTLTLKELELFMKGELNVPEKSVVITFDDGFKDNAYEAYPLLKEYGFNAVNFLITGLIEKHDHHYEPGSFQYLSLDDLHNSCDVFEYGSHTYNFHKRTPDGDSFLISNNTKVVQSDIEVSIRHLDGSHYSFAFPYGEYNDTSIQLLRKLGFNMIFTSNYDDVHVGYPTNEIPRKEIFPDDGMKEFKAKLGHRR